MKVPVILGPTAVGKTKLTLKIGQDFNFEILSCDSRQVYKYMDIGTAKPSPLELNCVRHWLIDYLEPSQSYSAFNFSQDALKIIRDTWQCKKRIIISGGTGFYFNALKEGLNPTMESDVAVRNFVTERMQNEGAERLFDELQKIDPKTARKFHPNDCQRVIRALQVYYQTGIPLSKHNEMTHPPRDISFLIFILTMDRTRLYHRINQRVDDMFKKGLWEEFQSLRSKGFSRNDPGMQCVGYKELFDVEENKTKFSEAILAIKRNSRRYAKRQFTWFTNKTKGFLLDIEHNSTQSFVETKIDEFFKT